MQKLLTKDVARRLPRLYETQDDDDPVAQVKFFTPWSNWTWYATEFDGLDVFFGLVHGHFEELGYFLLSELESARGPAGLLIERDKWFTPTPISELRNRAA